jgi:hypothetical protein
MPGSDRRTIDLQGSLVPNNERELGVPRAKRLAEIIAELTASTPRPPDMAEAVYKAVIERLAMHQLVDEELRPRRRA